MLYPKNVIDQMNEWMDGSSFAKNWLEQHGYPELVQLKDAVSRHNKPFEYLLVNKHIELAAFVNAVWEDKSAFSLLMEKKAFHWAAMANYINGDENAGIFLRKNRLDHYLVLAQKILDKIRSDGDAGTTLFQSGPFKV